MAPLAVKKAKGRQRAFIERWHISHTQHRKKQNDNTLRVKICNVLPS